MLPLQLRIPGSTFLPSRITANLAPADVRKEGSAFDLPMALGVMAATGQIQTDNLDRNCWFWEN